MIKISIYKLRRKITHTFFIHKTFCNYLLKKHADRIKIKLFSLEKRRLRQRPFEI